MNLELSSGLTEIDAKSVIAIMNNLEAKLKDAYFSVKMS